MEKNKKAPARAKAKVDYLLTTKLFCGHCKAAMTGISGTSKTERKYHYYQCVTNRRDKSCDKKTVGKEYIEDLVVNRLRDFLTPDPQREGNPLFPKSVPQGGHQRPQIPAGAGGYACQQNLPL